MLAALLDIVAPQHCVGCRRPGEQLCRACQHEIDRHEPVVIRGEDGLATINAAGRYDGALRKAILAFKYGNHRSLAAPLAPALARRLHVECDVIVPVPLHPAREQARGFNQAELLALALARRLQSKELRVAPHALRRTQATHAQSKLRAIARERNVANAFSPGPDAFAIRDKSILLVDDVITTGATLRACAAALRLAGARRIDAACIASKL